MPNNRTDQLGLKLHETLIFSTDNGGYVQVMAVPGGWIYTTFAPTTGFLFSGGGLIEASVFVPDPHAGVTNVEEKS